MLVNPNKMLTTVIFKYPQALMIQTKESVSMIIRSKVIIKSHIIIEIERHYIVFNGMSVFRGNRRFPNEDLYDKSNMIMMN